MKKPINQQAALFKAILEEPWDDTHRLVYADWLEENGQAERGQFIRAQVERAHLAEDDPRARDLLRQETRLLKAHKSTWKAELPRLNGTKWGDFERGFVGSVSIRSAFMFHRLFRTIITLAPIEALQIRDASTLHGLAISPHLSRVRELRLASLSFSSSCTLAELAASPHLGRLVVLDLGDNSLDDQDARALVESRSFPRLEVLNLRSNEVGDVGASHLARSPHLRDLRELVLTGDYRLMDVGRRALREAFGERVVL
jgi:uncharacterized protein (TIGR02996 family)